MFTLPNPKSKPRFCPIRLWRIAREDVQQCAAIAAWHWEQAKSRGLEAARVVYNQHLGKLLRDLHKACFDASFTSKQSFKSRRSERRSKVAALLYGYGLEKYKNRGAALESFRRAFPDAANPLPPPPPESSSSCGKRGSAKRWGGQDAIDARRAKARAMRNNGATLLKIQEECGYKSLASAHYAVKELKGNPNGNHT